jgi:hypothetical protein
LKYLAPQKADAALGGRHRYSFHSWWKSYFKKARALAPAMAEAQLLSHLVNELTIVKQSITIYAKKKKHTGPGVLNLAHYDGLNQNTDAAVDLEKITAVPAAFF